MKYQRNIHVKGNELKNSLKEGYEIALQGILCLISVSAPVQSKKPLPTFILDRFLGKINYGRGWKLGWKWIS